MRRNTFQKMVTSSRSAKQVSTITPEACSVKPSKYTLQVGKDGEERLNILNELYNPLSKKFLQKAGIKAKRNILDVACGTGEMSCWMAQQTTGKVMAVDISEQQLEIGIKRAASLELRNIEFKKMSVFELEQLNESYDFIYCRFLLVHIQHPEKALQLMYGRLSNDGIMACEEATASISFCYPPTPAFDKWLSLWAALRKANRTDLDLGLKLPHIFRTIGCTDVRTDLVQPVLSTQRHKSILRLNTIETTKAAVEAKFDTEEGMEKLAADLEKLEKEEHLIGYVRNSQVWGRKCGFFNPKNSKKNDTTAEALSAFKSKL